MTEIASFDVFDTLLTRRVSPPDAIFLGLGRRLAARGLISLSAEVFARARCEAEHRSRGIASGGEPTLEQVYLEFVWAFELSTEIIPALVAEELSAEEEVIVPVPGAVERVARERSAGRKIAFLSDMYLPSTFIGKLLQKHGLMAKEDLLMVSCEYGSGKQTGLFEKLFNVAGVQAGQVQHIGNHMGSDITAARRVGVRATHLADANPNRYETILSEHRWATGGATAILAGASRLARLRVPVEDDHSRAIRDVAASVAAPLLACYVLWVLRQANAMGLHRLYFVSRDGQILHSIARLFAPLISSECKVFYLYGSRHAWHLPAVTEIDANEQAWMFEPSEFLSVNSQLERIGVSSDANVMELESVGFRRADWDRNLSTSERGRLRAWVLTDSVRSQIQAEAFRRRTLVLRYLRQEGVFEPGQWAVVDVGWRGRLLRSLAALTKAGGGTDPVGYYLGLTESVKTDALRRQAYLGERATGLGYAPSLLELAFMLELFCTADHGTVIGYEERNGRMEPILRELVNKSAAEWGLGVFHTTVGEVAAELADSPIGTIMNADFRGVLLEVVQAFQRTPEPDEARAWSRFRLETDHTGQNCSLFAHPYTSLDALRALWTGRLPEPYAPFWAAGALASSSHPTRTAITVGFRIRAVLAAILRRLRLSGYQH